MNSLEKLRVLIVDDNEDTGDSVAVLLNYWGHKSRRARDGIEALKVLVAGFAPHVLLVDIEMPHLNGIDLVKAVRRRWPDSKPLIVAITGFHDVKHRQACTEAGFDAYFVKPIELDVLADLLLSARAMAPSRALAPCPAEREPVCK